jgi:hypothetical protein
VTCPDGTATTCARSFTLLYAGLFLVSAAGLLAITYLLVARQLPSSLSLSTHSPGGALTGGSASV